MRSGYGAACAGKASARNFRPARAVRERVREEFGVTLVPEPVTVGIAW